MTYINFILLREIDRMLVTFMVILSRFSVLFDKL